MLPKLWKKVLLAICIIACLFNIMSKFVNRNSLEINLKSANDGKTIWDALKKDEEKPKSNPEYIDEMKNSTITEDTIENDIIIEENEEQSYVEEENIKEEDRNTEENQSETDTMDFSDNLKSVMKYFDN